MNGIPALAQTVQSQGRGKDTQLVHMTPNEVRGLQAIAMAHGGSLTVNPKTGLPEAGFLDQILPMVAGAALTIGTSGAINPAMAGMIVGGGTALVTGDVEKGFMAGLGAYGGGGLGQGFTAAGAETLAQPAAPGAMASTATPTVAPAATPTVAPAATTGATIPATNFSYSTQAAGAVPTPTDIAISNAPVGPTAAPITPPVTPPVTPPPVTSTGVSTLPADTTAALKSGAAYGPSSAPTMDYRFTQAGEGFKGVFSGGPEGTAARQAFMSDAGVGGLTGLAKYGGAAAMPLLAGGEEGAPAGPPQMIRPFTYDVGRTNVAYRTGAPGESTAEQRYFRPRYTAGIPYRAKGGGSVPELEAGGFVMTKKAVDGMGGGNNKKGQEALAKGLGAIPIKGKGTGTSDSIKTTIAGKTPARVSNGEAYIPKKNVKKAGGTTNMYALMRKAENKA